MNNDYDGGGALDYQMPFCFYDFLVGGWLVLLEAVRCIHPPKKRADSFFDRLVCSNGEMSMARTRA